MKLGKPLRRTGFTPAQRATRITRQLIARKRAKVSPEERNARKVVKARSDGRCEGCATPGPTDYSHRVGSGQGGPWTPANALALCRRCHSWLHHNLLQARRLGWYLRGFEDFRTIPVQHAWIGLVLLNDDGTTTRHESEEAA